jgi:hypothetical protein
MNCGFRVLASCVFAVIIPFGSLVGGAFAQTTPDPAEFSLSANQSQLVKLDPKVPSFTVVYSTPEFQKSTVTVQSGTCLNESITVPRGSLAPPLTYTKTFSCGQVGIVNFHNEGPGKINIQVSQ